ncbi:MAG: peptidase E [Armatimonadetes bacterium]|nr:peptidase E [Armatimonadota bacterium]
MRKLVAIGGGEIGRPGYPIETTEIDRKIIALTGKSKPKAMLLPTASGDSDMYFDCFRKHFGEGLGCNTDVLHLINAKPGKQEIEEKILGSDIVYVGGGNTARMMRIWRRLGVDEVLRNAWDKGIVLSGLSSGAICWFRFGCSDSHKFSDPNASLIRVGGMNLHNAGLCPHYDVELDRRPKLHEMMKKTPGVAIALDNCCAVEIVDLSFRVICSRENAHGYRVYRAKGTVVEEELPSDGKYRPLTDLLNN